MPTPAPTAQPTGPDPRKMAAPAAPAKLKDVERNILPVNFFASQDVISLLLYLLTMSKA